MSFNPQFSRIGEILVHLESASDDQVREAAIKQNNFNLKIGETLIKLGYIEESDLLNALHLQLEIPVVKEEEMLEIDSEVVALIPEPFAVENRVLAIKKEGNIVIVAMTDPENIVVHDSLRKMLDLKITPVLIGELTLKDSLERNYKSIRTTSQVENAVDNFDFVAMDDDDEEITIADQGTDADAPVVRLINLIISEAIKSNTTDIHIEPLVKQTRVRFRVDGALRESMTSPIGMHAGIISLIKVMSKLNIAE
ncbi:MAG: ATPase, T2SS/T4P/T4SS family, partial [Candidatus Cloacimonadota bacterium]|nr:ATPase, T2SS/T4P/T4SS family [Candidatus Cloacimonadota bacterium]